MAACDRLKTIKFLIQKQQDVTSRVIEEFQQLYPVGMTCLCFLPTGVPAEVVVKHHNPHHASAFVQSKQNGKFYQRDCEHFLAAEEVVQQEVCS